MRRIAALLFGCVLLGVGLGYAYNTVELGLFGERTTGTIIGWEESHLSPDVIMQKRPSRYEYPKVRFKTARGQVVTFIDNHGQLDPPPIGSTVEVHYNPRRPGHAEIVTGHEVYVIPLLLITFGTFCLLVTAFGTRW